MFRGQLALSKAQQLHRVGATSFTLPLPYIPVARRSMTGQQNVSPRALLCTAATMQERSPSVGLHAAQAVATLKTACGFTACPQVGQHLLCGHRWLPCRLSVCHRDAADNRWVAIDFSLRSLYSARVT
jgi:hypothetical protein